MMPKKRGHGDGGLYAIRGGKLYRGVIDGGFDADGKRVQWSVTARTKSACKAKLDALKAEIAENGAPLDKTTTVEKWAERWLETIAKPHVDPSTLTGYRSQLNQRILPAIGKKRVSALKPSDVRAVHELTRAQGRSGSTMRQSHIVVSEMLEAARKEGLCAKNVAKDVTIPKQASRARGALGVDQAVAILKAAAALPYSSGSRWWLKMLAGPRQGEITGATLENLDLDAGLYYLEWKLEEVPRDHGCVEPCGERPAQCPQAIWRVPDGFEMRHLEGRFCLTRPKSGKSRAVPLIPQLAEAIRQHIEATVNLPNPHGLIWRNTDGSPIHKKQDAQEWRDLLVAAGIISADEAVAGGTSLTGHVARHTTVTVLAEMGVDFQLIGEIVGHSTVEVTRIYRHANVAEKQRAAALVGDAWSAALPQIEG